jgi:uncharacterized protein with von Willebrand factor type A (vWA) domain
MFDLLLLHLRAREVKVGLGEWLQFLRGLRLGAATDLDGLYRFGRAVLVHDEGRYDAWDQAFADTFAGVPPAEVHDALARWLEQALRAEGERVDPGLSPEELLRQFEERLREQKERHDGGSKWVGTGGTSPFGSQGRAATGVRVGEGGGRSAIRVAQDRAWKEYRADRSLDHRDLAVALRALRSIAREGRLEVDLDETIDKTANNGGEIDIAERRGKRNRVHLVLMMDTGGSMEPHARLVEELFTAATETRGFKSFKPLFFHNVPYGYLYESWHRGIRKPIEDVMRDWTPHHRLVFVGDASMAPYELFAAMGGYGAAGGGLSGLDWLRRMRARCAASVWLNPDPPSYWDHPTVRGIANVFPMFPLTVPGLRDAVRVLRKPV